MGIFISVIAPCRVLLPGVQVSDTTGDDSSNVACQQKD